MQETGIVLSLLSFILIACEPIKPNTYPITVRVLDEDYTGLPGAPISVSKKVVGLTDAAGSLQTQIIGREGDQVQISARCPTGYRVLTETRNVVLRSFTQLPNGRAVGGPELIWECDPVERFASLVIRAPGQSDLPILVEGKEIARTNPDGAAHALIRQPPESEIRVTLDTSRKPELRPQNPVRAFQIKDQDDILIFDQDFHLQRRAADAKKRKPLRIVPYRIQ